MNKKTPAKKQLPSETADSTSSSRVNYVAHDADDSCLSSLSDVLVVNEVSVSSVVSLSSVSERVSHSRKEISSESSSSVEVEVVVVVVEMDCWLELRVADVVAVIADVLLSV